MNPQAPEVVRLAEHVGSRLGEACGGGELVADRRGSRVYRLQFPTRNVALKLAFHNADEQGVREAEHLARREAAVLTCLHDFAPGYLIDSGDLDGGGSWLALRWLDGITPHRFRAPARHGDDSPDRRDSILRGAVDVVDRLAQLHARGWLHADLQPAHILLGSTAVHLIDFALAQGPCPLPSDVIYRGGMVHFTAPETAAHILTTSDDQSIAIDEPAEVYALAAVLHLAWTGLFPTTYTHDQAPWRDKLKDVARGRHHDLAAIRPWPPFENALRHALTTEPKDRIPSMTGFPRRPLILEYLHLTVGDPARARASPPYETHRGGSQTPMLEVVGVVESDRLVLRVDDDLISIGAGASIGAPDLVEGSDVVAESAGAVLLDSPAGADLGGGAVGVAHSERAEWAVVVVVDAGKGEVEQEAEVVVVEGVDGHRNFRDRGASGALRLVACRGDRGRCP